MSLVVDQPRIKKTFALKNPVFLKRNTLNLERDAINRNTYFIQFSYDALLDFNMNIYFNSIFDKERGVFVPGNSFKNKVINVSQIPKGQNLKFFDRSVFIDVNYYNQNKEEIENSFDLVIELVPILSNINRSKKYFYFYL